MAQTLGTLIQESRNLLGDLTALDYDFTDAQLEDFINQAIRVSIYPVPALRCLRYFHHRRNAYL